MLKAIKVNDAEIYAASSEADARAAHLDATHGSADVESVEQMPAGALWIDEQHPEHKTVGDVLASLTGSEARWIGVDADFL